MGRPEVKPAATRVASRDGTQIVYWTSGSGPPLVLVHGTTADHTRWRPLLPYLEPHATVHAIDRRGRGASEDARDYDPRREFEDVAAVVEAVADAAGVDADVYGHSFGAFCALGAALLTTRIRRLVLYEPPLSAEESASPPGVVERIDGLVAAGDPEGAVETMFREVVQAPEEELDALRAQPSWPSRVAAAHTIAREVAAVPGPLDLSRTAGVIVPALVLMGADSPAPVRADAEAAAAALPDARTIVLDGQQHVADVLAPDVFAEHVLAFLRSA